MEERCWIGCGDPGICTYELLQENARRKMLASDYWGAECYCPAMPHQLFRTRHKIHDEVMSLVYSENQFTISRDKTQPIGHHFGTLRKLNPQAWKRIHVMRIEISQIQYE